LASSEWLEEENERLRQQIEAQARRLDYAVMQLDREAKFLPEWKPENRRFHRAYTVVAEVRDALREIR
jgi:hypothetical protein